MAAPGACRAPAPGKTAALLSVCFFVAHLHARLLASSRRSSEDLAAVFERGDDLVIVVADGAGGLRGGAAAGDTLVEVVRGMLADRAIDVHDARAWMGAFRAADLNLAAEMAGETTAVLVVVGKHEIVGISAGDSEAWLVNADSIDDLTGSQKRMRLGSGRMIPIPFHRSLVRGSLVVATDGLFKYAAVDAIAAAVRTEGEADTMTRHLASLAQTQAGTYHDDLAVVVVPLDP